MRRFLVGIACVVALAAAVAAQQDALQQAATTLGVANVNTLAITGTGKQFSVGQNYLATDPWPAITVKSYTAEFNFGTRSMRQDLTREQPSPTMPRGGGAPFQGEQRQVQVVSGDYAWNQPPQVATPAAEAGRINVDQALALVGARPQPPAAQPAPANAVERMLWVATLTPQGFVKAAQANNATSKKGRNNTTEVTFTLAGKYPVTGVINAQGQVEQVRTMMYQSIVGDMPVVVAFTDYKDMGGVQFPGKIVQSQDGFPALEVNVTGVRVNPDVNIAVPANVQQAASAPAAPAPITVTSAELGKGAWFLTGGTHHSMVVDMKDGIVIVDLPNNQARAQAVIAKAKELVPNKKVQYVITSHHHWDHLGGIREAFAEGATIITHESNKQFLERVAKAPHTLNPDRQAMVKGKARIKTVRAMDRLTDGTRTIELYLMTDFDHDGDMLMVYLPQEKVLGLPDAFTPAAQVNGAVNPPAAAFGKSLYDNIQRLKLDVATLATFHGNRTSTMAELGRVSGATPATN
jgi:glyoxylase-like metal-dependent hydrolase (beta-lactamase superfamily II)